MIIMQREAELFELAAALKRAGPAAGLLNGRHQQRYQDRDNRDHHQQFDQRECATVMTAWRGTGVWHA